MEVKLDYAWVEVLEYASVKDLGMLYNVLFGLKVRTTLLVCDPGSKFWSCVDR